MKWVSSVLYWLYFHKTGLTYKPIFFTSTVKQQQIKLWHWRWHLKLSHPHAVMEYLPRVALRKRLHLPDLLTGLLPRQENLHVVEKKCAYCAVNEMLCSGFPDHWSQINMGRCSQRCVAQRLPVCYCHSSWCEREIKVFLKGPLFFHQCYQCTFLLLCGFFFLCCIDVITSGRRSFLTFYLGKKYYIQQIWVCYYFTYTVSVCKHVSNTIHIVCCRLPKALATVLYNLQSKLNN